MAGYVIGQVEITDPETYKKYVEQVPATVAQYGGEYLVRGGATDTLEGEWPQRRTVVLRFPSVADAKAWHSSAEYEGPKAIRHAAANSDMIVVEGV
ncbi:MAG: DUF1330 domain-containing protein [Gammaproteobacteria bacterium]|nr:DUF1330 domain-containing protein [Gammaproteobacteria bacterium]